MTADDTAERRAAKPLPGLTLGREVVIVVGGGAVDGFRASAVTRTDEAFVRTTNNHRRKQVLMEWWILELIFVAVMLVVLAGLGPLIKRFGRAYAADVFQANPRTGKSYLVLMDIAYYMIFGAYVLFVIKWEPDTHWSDQVNAAQLEGSVVRLGGMVLLMGLLHGLNVLSLPLIGRVFTLNRRLDEDVAAAPLHPRRTLDQHHDSAPDRDAGVIDIAGRGETWQRPAPPRRAE